MKDLAPILKTLWKNKTGPLLLIMQIAVAFTILINISFMAVSKLHELKVPSGLDEDVLFSFRTNFPVEPEQYAARIKQDLRDIKSVEGVENATTVNSIPLSSWGQFYSVNEAEDPDSYIAYAGAYSGSKGFIDTLGLEIVAGRGFEESEVQIANLDYHERPNSILVTQGLAERISPEDWSTAAGITVYINGQPYQVVGIIKELVAVWPSWTGNERSIVFPTYHYVNEGKFMVKTKPGELEQVMEGVKDLLMQQPGRFVADLEKFKDTREKGYKGMESSLIILMSVTVGLIILTMLGVFGQARFTLMKRRRQIGTRRALGASKSHIMRYYIIESILVAGTGVIVGSLMAVLLNVKLMEIFRVDSVPLEYFLYGGLIVLVASLVAVIPTAYSAANISPATATRSV
ncbi:ABC transporter permease [Pseudoalteromonas luteoviolacea]|uniref:ABC transporter permease n=1 Tax=Pseudoalteromonas luteoviolacea TaxID=43657 RepID=UPI001F2A903D|nr:FtsX-like permease family protein [Pseudoalteromonas luteoviolacea]MCF6438186.1 ABC transporter permease [Pseudoalteromonas luteoviolacea]